jgi:hypothetical protein
MYMFLGHLSVRHSSTQLSCLDAGVWNDWLTLRKLSGIFCFIVHSASQTVVWQTDLAWEEGRHGRMDSGFGRRDFLDSGGVRVRIHSIISLCSLRYRLWIIWLTVPSF